MAAGGSELNPIAAVKRPDQTPKPRMSEPAIPAGSNPTKGAVQQGKLV